MTQVTLENFTAFVKEQKGNINHSGWDCCAVGLFLRSVKSKLGADKAIRQILGLPTKKGTHAVRWTGDDGDFGLIQPKRSRTKAENLYIQLERGAAFPEVATFRQLAKKLEAIAA